MLMSANQLEHRCEKYRSLFLDQDLHCVTRQTDQTAPMCEIDDLSHSQEAQRKEADTLLEELIMYCQ